MKESNILKLVEMYCVQSDVELVQLDDEATERERSLAATINAIYTAVHSNSKSCTNPHEDWKREAEYDWNTNKDY